MMQVVKVSPRSNSLTPPDGFQFTRYILNYVQTKNSRQCVFHCYYIEGILSVYSRVRNAIIALRTRHKSIICESLRGTHSIYICV